MNTDTYAAFLDAMKTEAFARADALPQGPMEMYAEGQFTGLMNGIDPASPHCTEDPAQAVRYFAMLVELIEKHAAIRKAP